MSRLLSLFALVLLLVACAGTATPDPQPAPPSPSATSPAATVASPTETALPAEPPAAVPSPTTPPTAPPVALTTSTPLPPADLGPLPDPATLQWEAIPSDSGTLRQLNGLTTPLLNVLPAPDGSAWAVEVARESGDMGVQDVGLYVLSGTGGPSWLASAHGTPGFHHAAWLPGGRLLWASGDTLWLANADGSARRDLVAPEAVYEVWAGAGDMALAGGETALWRVNVAAGEWEQVPGWEIKGRPVSDSGANLTMAPDGSFAALIWQGELWRVPMAAGEAMQRLAAIEYPGRGGRISPPLALADSPYWWTGERVLEFPAIEMSAMLLDSRDGTLVPPRTLAPLAEGYGGFLSLAPDGRWVAFQAGPDSSYIAPSADLAAGHFVAGAPLGWGTDFAVIITNEQGLARLSLPDGTETPILGEMQLQRGGLAVAVGGDTFFMSNGATLAAFATDGTPRATLDLPIPPSLVHAAGTRALVPLATSSGDATIWLWEP